MAKQQSQAVIFRPWTTTRDGKVIWARDYGLRAFPIPVGDNKDRKKPKKQ